MTGASGKASKSRLDALILERGLTDSREKARALVLAGQVRVNGQVADKAGRQVSRDADIEIETPPPFVGRGGEKLEGAFLAFNLCVEGKVCLDVGSSTGGFTDCMLQHGAERVFAVDVGKGQLHWKLRNDPRVTVMEQVNARYLKNEDFDVAPEFAAIDVSFISLTLVMPAVIEVLKPGSTLVTLIKPQFEAEREQVGKGGVVRDDSVRTQVLEKVRYFGTSKLLLHWVGCVESPLRGPAGNTEFLAYWSWG